MATKRELQTVLSLEGESKYSAGMKRIQRELRNVATEHSLLNSQYDKGDRSLSKLTRQQELLQRKLEEQRKKVKLISDAYAESAKHGEEAAETTAALARDLNMANAAVNKTEREIKKLSAELEHTNSRAYQFAEAMRNMGVNSQSVGSAMQTVGDRVSKLSLAIAGAVTATSVKGWMTLEDEMANVATIADTSSKSMTELTGEIVEASNVTGIAAAEMAKAQYQAISANVATAESAGLVANAAKAAKAGVSDVTTVIDGATSIMNSWSIATAESEAVFDKLLKTQQRGKTTIGELASTIGQVTGLAPQLNISLDETLAAVGALTQNGVQTSTAMNGLKAVMSAILKPTAEAREEAERLGLQFDSAALKAKGFTGFLADVVAKTGGSEDSLAKLFGSVEGLSQIMLLGGSAAGMYADILTDLGNSAGTLNEMFDQRTNSAAQRFALSMNKINNAAIALGQSLAPMIDVAADKVESFANAVGKMSAEEAQNVIKTALWVAGISKGVSVLGGLVKHASTAAAAIKAMGTLLTPSGAVIAGLGAAAAAVAGLSALTKKFSAEATLDLTIDESDLDNYKVDSHTLTDPIAINAQAKLTIAKDLNSISDELVKWLTDGLPETEEEYATYSGKINAAIDGVYSQIQSHYSTKKAELDALFAAGVISDEVYNASLAELETQASTMQSDLTTAADAVTTYISTLVANNRTITEDEIAQLNTLLDTLNATSATIIDATNAAQQAYEWAYKKTGAGVGDENDRKKAVEYIELKYATDKSGLENAEKAVKASYASKASTASEAELKLFAKQEAAELRKIQEQMDQLEAEREAMYAELLKGELKKAGLTEEDVETAIKNAGWETDAQLMEQATRLLATGQMKEYGELMSFVETVEKVKDADLSGLKSILAFFTTNTGGDASEAADMTATFEKLFEAAEKSEELSGVPGEYTRIGNEAINGLDSALRAGYPRLRKTAAGIGSLIAQETREVLKIHSPSRVFADIGRFTMEGLIGGVNSRLDKVQSTYRDAVAPKAVAKPEARPAAPTKTTVINNHINYTAGAGTRREARMLNQRLAQEQQAALIAEGL